MKFLRIWGPAAFCLLLIIIATSIPNLDTWRWPGWDKVFHLSVYGLWAMLCLRALHLSRQGKGTVLISVVILGILVGAADELHEKFIPGRTVSLSDFAYNAAGFVLGMAAGYIRYFRRGKSL